MSGYLLIDETASFINGDAWPADDAPTVRGLRRRWRRFLYLRVCFFDDAGAPAGDAILRAERIDGHSMWMSSEFAFCLDDEKPAECMPRNLDVFGGGRRDCCVNHEQLAPEAFAFCRSVMRAARCGAATRSGPRPGTPSGRAVCRRGGRTQERLTPL